MIVWIDVLWSAKNFFYFFITEKADFVWHDFGKINFFVIHTFDIIFGTKFEKRSHRNEVIIDSASRKSLIFEISSSLEKVDWLEIMNQWICKVFNRPPKPQCVVFNSLWACIFGVGEMLEI